MSLTQKDIKETIDKVNQNVSKFQLDNRKLFENNVDTFRKYQEQINQVIQQISKNTIELQKNVFNTYQSSYSRFFDNVTNNHYWNNFNFSKKYSETYNTIDKNIQDYTVNATNLINEISTGAIENFNKAIELSWKYYNNTIQNIDNYSQKIERSYNRH